MYISFAKFCCQINFALISHSITYWMRDNGFNIPISIFFGSIFTFPYLLKYYLAHLIIKYFNYFARNPLFLYLFEIFCGLSLTIFPLQSAGFCLCALCASSIGAILDSLLLAEFYSRNINYQTPEKFGATSYGLELVGLIIGSDLPFFLSNYLSWIFVYRYTLLITFIIKLICIGNKRLDTNEMPLNVIKDFLSCCKQAKNVIIITILYKLQSAIISHTPTVYLKSIEYSQLYISLARLVAHIGMIYAVYKMRNIYRVENYLSLTVSLKGILLFLIAGSVYLRYDNCSIIMIIIEKIGRGVESCILTSIQAKYSINSSHFVALSALSNFVRFALELFVGFIQNLLGWSVFFIFVGCVSILVLWQIHKRFSE